MRPTFAVYDLATSDAGWPPDDETTRLIAAILAKTAAIIAKHEPENDDELRVYRDVLRDFIMTPLDGAHGQTALVDRMRSVIAAKEVQREALIARIVARA